jgi:hypothetical protein
MDPKSASAGRDGTRTHHAPQRCWCIPMPVLQKCTQSDEMIVIQVLLLFAQRRQRARLSVCLPGAVALFGFLWTSPLPQIVLPDGERGFQE